MEVANRSIPNCYISDTWQGNEEKFSAQINSSAQEASAVDIPLLSLCMCSDEHNFIYVFKAVRRCAALCIKSGTLPYKLRLFAELVVRCLLPH